MTTWNYRLIADLKEVEWLAIHSVYYDDGVPHSWSVEPCAVNGASVDEAGETLQLMLMALAKPVLYIDGDNLTEIPPIERG